MISRPFAVFDIDGTLVRWQLYHAVADTLAKRGYIDESTYQAIRDARMSWKKRTSPESFKDYERQLVRAYEAILAHLSVEQFEMAAQLVFDEYKDQVYTYTRDLIRSLKKNGYLLFAISNSQTEIVEKIASYWGFDDYIGANYEQRGGHFTGKRKAYLHDKDLALTKLVHKHNASWENSIAAGDSTSDIPMLRLVNQPIAFNPEKKLFDEAKKQRWKIVVERKNVVYILKSDGQSYKLG